MRALLLLVLSGLSLSGLPLSAQVVLEPSGEDIPGYPPALGEVRVTEGGAEAVFTTYDFSIGAFDASAWIEGMASTPRFRVTAYPGADPKAEKGLLLIEASFARALEPGMITQEARVEVLIGKERDGRRWTSAGGRAEVEIFDFVPQEAGAASGYGRMTGQFTARICSGDKDPPVVAANARCREISGRFETDVQYSP